MIINKPRSSAAAGGHAVRHHQNHAGRGPDRGAEHLKAGQGRARGIFQNAG